MRGMTLLNTVVIENDRAYNVDFYNKKINVEDNMRYSMIIGPNGVGKSCLLRAIIDFWFDYDDYRERGKILGYNSRSSRFFIKELTYCLEGKRISISRNGRRFLFKLWDNDGCILDDEYVSIPNIIAVHYGLYDRFPIKTKKRNRDFYKYVGAKASSNFITANNVMTQILSTLCSIDNIEVEQRLKFVFEKMGYSPQIRIRTTAKKARNVADMSLESMKMQIQRMINRQNSFFNSAYNKVKDYDETQWMQLYGTYELIHGTDTFDLLLNWDNIGELNKNTMIYRNIYLLKQLLLVDSIDYVFYKDGEEISSNMLSSGELNMLGTVISIVSLVGNGNNIVLIDEPELSQHPNWQMGMISQLDDILADFSCHIIIATHSHLMVSDLPLGKSCVIQMEHNGEGLFTRMIESDTYGWSAEDVLLQVFHTTTDRNKYFGNMVADLLQRIGNNNISQAEVETQLEFISMVSKHLHDGDPMKLIVETIVNAYKEYGAR